jgi:hypothetical protein
MTPVRRSRTSQDSSGVTRSPPHTAHGERTDRIAHVTPRPPRSTRSRSVPPALRALLAVQHVRFRTPHAVRSRHLVAARVSLIASKARDWPTCAADAADPRRSFHLSSYHPSHNSQYTNDRTETHTPRPHSRRRHRRLDRRRQSLRGHAPGRGVSHKRRDIKTCARSRPTRRSEIRRSNRSRDSRAARRIAR